MTKNQEALYWREWSSLRGYCKAKQLPDPDRHQLHVQALGSDKSHKHFTNEDFDLVLAVFRAMSRPGSVDSQLRQIRQPLTRLQWKMRNIVIACLRVYVGDRVEDYIREVCRDKFHLADWTDLSEVQTHPEKPSQLEGLIWTLEARINGKKGFRATAGHSLHEMRMLAGVACNCSACVHSPVVAVAPDALVGDPF